MIACTQSQRRHQQRRSGTPQHFPPYLQTPVRPERRQQVHPHEFGGDVVTERQKEGSVQQTDRTTPSTNGAYSILMRALMSYASASRNAVTGATPISTKKHVHECDLILKPVGINLHLASTHLHGWYPRWTVPVKRPSPHPHPRPTPARHVSNLAVQSQRERPRARAPNPPATLLRVRHRSGTR